MLVVWLALPLCEYIYRWSTTTIATSAKYNNNEKNIHSPLSGSSIYVYRFRFNAYQSSEWKKGY